MYLVSRMCLKPFLCREDAEKAVIEVLFKPRNGLAGAQSQFTVLAVNLL
jgi:hypothetical protein